MNNLSTLHRTQEMLNVENMHLLQLKIDELFDVDLWIMIAQKA